MVFDADHDDSRADGLGLRGISVRFGGLVALDDVSLAVHPGQVVGVIGPNGAGKTTLFNAVCGFVRPYAGAMSWRGSPLRPRPDRLAELGIARTLQGVGLFRGLTAVQNVMLGATRHARAGFGPALLGLPNSDRDERDLRDRAHAYLEEVGAAGYAQALPDRLPYAIRKRIALARALAVQPSLLLLDEPAGGLAADEISALAELIRSLPNRSSGCSVMLVEHHMDFVMGVCDHVVVLDFGKVIAAGPPAAMRHNAAVSDAYLGTVAPEPDGTGPA
jgi:branched-chain amino acid transport system ATP-binding protein